MDLFILRDSTKTGVCPSWRYDKRNGLSRMDL